MHDLELHSIPSIDLESDNKKVSFAFRTMEEIHKRTGGKPDIPHRHNYFTILWAKNVCGLHYIDYMEYGIRPNYIFFVNPGQVHQVITYGEPEGFVIMFTQEFLQQNQISEEFVTNLGLFSQYSTTPPILVNSEASVRLGEIVKNIELVFHEESPYKLDLLAAYLRVFLIESNKYAPQPETENTQTLQSTRIILKEFKSLVESKFVEWHKVGDYSKQLNITSDYLNNVIKSTIGKTAKEFIQNRLVLEAKRLGLHTHLSTKEIAFQLGFDDPSHFSKFFKNIENKAFSDFRIELERSLV